MKKKVKSRTQQFRPLILYFEDLEYVFEILNSASLPIRIETEEHEYDSLTELTSFSMEAVHHLKILAGNYANPPLISLSLLPYKAELYTYQDDIVSRGLFEKIKERLEERERYYARFISFNVAFLLVFLSITLSSTYYWQKDVSKVFSPYSILLSLSGIGMALLTNRVKYRHYSTIHLTKKIERVSFLRKNQDQLLVAVISAIVGALITWFLTR